MNIVDHRLEGVPYQKSPNRGGQFSQGNPDTIVIHYTAGANAESSIDFLCDPESRASAHLVVSRDGDVTQLLPFDTIGWHAGRSQWNRRTYLNNYSVGIEIDNAGLLLKQNGHYKSWFGQEYPAEDVLCGTHRNRNLPNAPKDIRQSITYWHRYTEIQLEKVEAICCALISTYDISYILGHEEIAPDRKVDPGPAFPLDEMRNRLLNNT